MMECKEVYLVMCALKNNFKLMYSTAFSYTSSEANVVLDYRCPTALVTYFTFQIIIVLIKNTYLYM